MSTTAKNEYITVKEASERLGVTMNAVRRYMKANTLKWRRKNERESLVLSSSVDELKYRWDNPTQSYSSA